MDNRKLLSNQVAGAFANFFQGGKGASRSDILAAVRRADLNSSSNGNKATLILYAFDTAQSYVEYGDPSSRQRDPEAGLRLVKELLPILELRGIGNLDAETDEQRRLRSVLAQAGFSTNEQGELFGSTDVVVPTGQREALTEALNRLWANQSDPALLIGGTKELLESVGKFVLEAHGVSFSKDDSFNRIMTLAQTSLGIRPQQGDSNTEAFETVREIHQHAWSIARLVNVLRNSQGTGHGKTLATGVSAEMARLVSKEALLVADYMLRLLDKQQS